jgi:hypothetical protein
LHTLLNTRCDAHPSLGAEIIIPLAGAGPLHSGSPMFEQWALCSVPSEQKSHRGCGRSGHLAKNLPLRSAQLR